MVTNRLIIQKESILYVKSELINFLSRYSEHPPKFGAIRKLTHFWVFLLSFKKDFHK